MGVFESIYTSYSGAVDSIGGYAGSWAGMATTAFAASGALYFMILGFLVLRGAVARPVEELGWSGIKIGIAFLMITQWGQVQSTIEQLGPQLMGNPNGNIGQMMDDYVDSVKVLNAAMQAKQKTMDDAIAAQPPADVGQAIGQAVVGITGIDLDKIVTQIQDMLALIVAWLCAAVSGAVGFCILFFAEIAFKIVLAFTPFGVACAFWPQTRWFFQGWLSQAINYVILYVVLGIMGHMITSAATSTVTNFLGDSSSLMIVGAAPAAAANPAALGAALTFAFFKEAIEVALVYLVGMFMFFQAPSIASGIAGGAASGGHTFLATMGGQAAGSAISRMGGGGRSGGGSSSSGGSMKKG